MTFGFRGSENAVRHQGQGLLVFSLGWALTSGSLALLSTVAPAAPHAVELAVLVVANLAATVLRFVLLRQWVFRPRPGATALPHPATDPAGERAMAGPSQGALR